MNSANAWLPENSSAKPDMWKIIVTCEHGANRVPKKYRHLFASAENILATHRGYDIGAAQLARRLSKVFPAPLFTGKYSRLLADLNRHPGHRNVFSRFTAGLDMDEKQYVLKTYHAPYRRAVENHIQEEVANNGKVLHLSVHSFTPLLNGKIRSADIGFLYDPKRVIEKNVARLLLETFKNNLNTLRHRCNYPYLGVSDSLTTALRKKFSDACYAGIEFEINQKLALGNPAEWNSFQSCFCRIVRMALRCFT